MEKYTNMRASEAFRAASIHVISVTCWRDLLKSLYLKQHRNLESREGIAYSVFLQMEHRKEKALNRCKPTCGESPDHPQL